MFVSFQRVVFNLIPVHHIIEHPFPSGYEIVTFSSSFLCLSSVVVEGVRRKVTGGKK